jgi:N-carbamoyl-L-amino-acid hydrolase
MRMTLPPLNIDGERLWNSLMTLARIGATPKGGSRRLALSREDGEGRDLVTGWMRDAGLEIHVDEIGNIFGIRPGRDARLPPVAAGSHIDTQPSGGKFDGCFGVMAGLEVMRTLQAHGVWTCAPLALIIWTNEEGSRFAPALMGSGVHCGVFSKEAMLRTADLAGKRVEDELKAIGYLGGTPIGAIRPACYFEAHIEQGPVLENENKVIGVVTGSLGMRWWDATITGMEAHAGPTPMSARRDALYAAAGLMRAVIDIAGAPDFAPYGRGTVGEVHVYPNSRNVIPGEVSFTIDLRHHELEQLDAMERRLRRIFQAARDDPAQPVEARLEDVQAFPPTPFAPALVKAVEASAAARGYPRRPILTGAGHDAVYMAKGTPTAMIFVPCKDGISHNEAEDAKPEHLEAGANVLLDVLLAEARAV